LESDRVSFRVERDVLQSRLEIARGSYEPAFRRLKKTLKLAAPREGARGWRAALWKVQLASEQLAVIEAYMLLAVAAYETGHTEDARWAAQEAREHGADLRALTELLSS
jgi:hypothetical protein